MTNEKPKSHFDNGGQVLKTRDDFKPVLLARGSDAGDGSRRFRLDTDFECSWVKSNEVFGPEKLRPRIEPWLTSLVQSEHLSLLLGSGLTHAVHRLAAEKPGPGMNKVSFGGFDLEIAKEAKRAAGLAGRNEGNLEDQIRAASELLRGLEIMTSTKDEDSTEQRQVTNLRRGLEVALTSLSSSILEAERILVSAPGAKREAAFN